MTQCDLLDSKEPKSYRSALAMLAFVELSFKFAPDDHLIPAGTAGAEGDDLRLSCRLLQRGVEMSELQLLQQTCSEIWDCTEEGD